MTSAPRIRRAHVLVHASLMEGGAQVIIEALTAGTHRAWSSAGVFTTVGVIHGGSSGETAEGRLLDNRDRSMMFAPPRDTSLPSTTAAPPAPPDAVTTTALPGTVISQAPFIPDWMLYLIWGLLAIVMLALFIILAVVLKIKRF
jgi:hypothetical protein